MARRAYILIPVSVAAAAALLAGCQEHTDTWNCFNPARQACSQWTATADGETLKQQKVSCGEMGGRVGEGSCPEENVIGSCLAGGADISRIVYYAPRKASEARRTCLTLGGTWR